MIALEPFSCPKCKHRFIPYSEKSTLRQPDPPILDPIEWETIKNCLDKHAREINKESINDEEFRAINKLFSQATVNFDKKVFSNPEKKSPHGWSNEGIKVEP